MSVVAKPQAQVVLPLLVLPLDGPGNQPAVGKRVRGTGRSSDEGNAFNFGTNEIQDVVVDRDKAKSRSSSDDWSRVDKGRLRKEIDLESLIEQSDEQ